jgi:Na+/proline symporter
MLSSYFSAILSTADSCLMAASGNIVTDIIAKFSKKELTKELQLSQIVTRWNFAILLFPNAKRIGTDALLLHLWFLDYSSPY